MSTPITIEITETIVDIVAAELDAVEVTVTETPVEVETGPVVPWTAIEDRPVTGAVGLALLAMSALTAGSMLLGNGTGAPTELATTSYGRSFLGLADIAAGRSLLGLATSDSATFAAVTATNSYQVNNGGAAAIGTISQDGAYFGFVANAANPSGIRLNAPNAAQTIRAMINGVDQMALSAGIAAFSGVVMSGAAGNGTGGNFRSIHDGGSQKWLAGILGTVGARNYSIYDMAYGER